jgi:hypothetical protein
MKLNRRELLKTSLIFSGAALVGPAGLSAQLPAPNRHLRVVRINRCALLSAPSVHDNQ